ncbi:hypothetical protein F25303_6050 [Fusarium sp. NRRL 25303]|nr:hypothetical protein F25303_6050 [Fusarium sp. NRRL 25303]
MLLTTPEKILRSSSLHFIFNKASLKSLRADQRQNTYLTIIIMPHSIDLNDQEAKDAESDRWLALVFHHWQTSFPVPSPKEPVYKFSESALQVGHFKEDVPSDLSSTNPNPNPNCEKGAKAYLMVKRDMGQTGFLWCDAEGKPVDKQYIQITEGLDIRLLKEDLADMYNIQERRLVAKRNEDVKVAILRRAIRRVEAAGPSEPAVVRDEDYL